MRIAIPLTKGILAPHFGHCEEFTIAGGMGERAQGLFARNGIQVLVGAPDEPPERIGSSFLDGTLQSGANLRDH